MARIELAGGLDALAAGLRAAIANAMTSEEGACIAWSSSNAQRQTDWPRSSRNGPPRINQSSVSRIGRDASSYQVAVWLTHGAGSLAGIGMVHGGDHPSGGRHGCCRPAPL